MDKNTCLVWLPEYGIKFIGAIEGIINPYCAILTDCYTVEEIKIEGVVSYSLVKYGNIGLKSLADSNFKIILIQLDEYSPLFKLYMSKENLFRI